jgi:hypothetical protein
MVLACSIDQHCARELHNARKISYDEYSYVQRGCLVLEVDWSAKQGEVTAGTFGPGRSR